MRKSQTSNPNGGPSFQAPRYRPNWMMALICFFLGAYLTVALVAYDPAQSPFDHKPVPPQKNPAGLVGAYIAAAMLRTFGAAAWFVPLALFWLLIVSLRNSKHLTGTRVIGIIVFLVASSALFSMWMDWRSDWYPNGVGGLVGL